MARIMVTVKLSVAELGVNRRALVLYERLMRAAKHGKPLPDNITRMALEGVNPSWELYMAQELLRELEGK